MSRQISQGMALPSWMPRILPFACYIAFLAAGSSIAHFLPDPRWIYGMQISATVLVLAIFARQYGELLRPSAVSLSEWSIAVLLGALVFVLWVNLELPFLTVGESAGFDPSNAGGVINWSLAIVRIFGAAAVVPVMEELFWRSLILRWLERSDFLNVDPRACGIRAIVLSSIVFGFEHTLWFAGILAGLAYGWLYRRSGNLWVPIIAHATTNLMLGIWVLHTGNWRFW
jgi:uncharacterized protein